ncbi:MAG: hypothetical protein JXD19_09860 [Deltaproteobacteria bacterium]|nr:hypothetical protein [Deltaproteobacteria bacterium]
MKKKGIDTKDFIVVKGILIPADWNADGGVKALAVATRDEEQYLLVGSIAAKDLFQFLHEEIEVSGRLKIEDDNKVIEVETYKKSVRHGRGSERKVNV